MAMQSTNDYLLRLAAQEHKSQSRAQIAILSCELATQTIRKAMAKIVLTEARKPTITRKAALKANKRDYQPLKAVPIDQKVLRFQYIYTSTSIYISYIYSYIYTYVYIYLCIYTYAYKGKCARTYLYT
jgi:hypothetical protein